MTRIVSLKIQTQKTKPDDRLFVSKYQHKASEQELNKGEAVVS